MSRKRHKKSSALRDIIRVLRGPRGPELDQLKEKLDNPHLFTDDEITAIALGAINNLRFCCEILFLAVEGYQFQTRPIHKAVFAFFEGIEAGKYKRSIINIPPGFGKTHTFKAWVCRAFLRDDKVRFLHLSFSQELVSDNSLEIKTILSSPIAQAIRSVTLRKDSSGKLLWRTDNGGSFRAAPTGGQVTGFRAGRIGYEGFSGALIIDDPVKPDDAESEVKSDRVNRRYKSTVASRLACEDIPIVVIMQRVCPMDLSGWLLGGGSGEFWHHLVIPPEITEEDLDPSKWEEYQNEWKYGIPVDHGLPLGLVWEEKLSAADIAVKKALGGEWWSQYRQKPKPVGGQMFSKEYFDYWDEHEGWQSEIVTGNRKMRLQYYMIFADTAQKDGEQNDYSVFQLWARGPDQRIYLIDQIRGKWEAPELEVAARAFLDRYKYVPHAWGCEWRECVIEDKVSGTGLIQSITKDYSGRVVPKQRNRDKYVRACDAAPHIKARKIVLPRNAIWLADFLAEVEAFSRLMTHKHDDQLDPMFDAIEDMLGDINEADYSGVAA